MIVVEENNARKEEETTQEAYEELWKGKPMEKLYTPEDAAEILKISPTTVEGMAAHWRNSWREGGWNVAIKGN